MSKKIYYIETTLNGYVFKRIEICDWDKDLDYVDKLIFKLDDEEVNYYEDIAGDMDELDAFLRTANHGYCEDYDDVLGTKRNTYLEFWKTTILGYYDDRYIGLEIK